MVLDAWIQAQEQPGAQVLGGPARGHAERQTSELRAHVFSKGWGEYRQMQAKENMV